MSDRPKAPAGTFWRGDVLYGRTRQNGKLIVWSLHTSNPKVAAERRADRVVVDAQPIRRKVARLMLSKTERAFLSEAIDAAEIRQRMGKPREEV